jgi:ATP-dependent DNA helicase RecQ
MPFDQAKSPLDILRSVFGFEAFRGQQAEIIDHLVGGGDALVLMPTGGGKSLCYQIPALCRAGLGVVVSPLIALMQDQVEALKQLGVRAAALNSALSYDESRAVQEAMRAGQIDLVYVAPERLLTESFLSLLARCRVALFAIDEAHCVSQWGHDFRPEYRQLTVLHERFPDVPRIALTATADGPTRRDILERLELAEGRAFAASFDRPNIRYRVQPKLNPRGQLRAFLADHQDEAGIVYCLSRGKVEETATWLAGEGITALPYHAGLDKAVRAQNQDRFIKEEAVVMVATIAFGMGIDKPDVRFVAHLDLPKSLEAYYQETGRAGRDGLPAEAWLVYGIQDVAKLQQLVTDSGSPEAQKRVERQKLDALLGFCETTRCRRQVLLGYFGESLAQPCGNCDTCLTPVESFDGTEAAQKVLSCVYRTGQLFGAAHVIDVLLGHDTERVRKFRHDALSTYGIGGELGNDAWRSVIRQLVALGLLAVDLEGHGGLRLGPDCRAVLRGERRIELRRDPAWKKTKSTKAGARAGGARQMIALDDPADEALFQALRGRRLALAKAQGVPPYVIFHDSTLLEMAQRKPRRLEELAHLTGVGQAKLQRYGSAFLDVVEEHRPAAD